MDNTYTLDDLSAFTQNEKGLLQDLGIETESDDRPEDISSPGKNVIDRILSYSRALSVRKSKLIGFVEHLNN